MCDGERILTIAGTEEQLAAGTAAAINKLVSDENALYYENPSVQYHSHSRVHDNPSFARVRSSSCLLCLVHTMNRHALPLPSPTPPAPSPLPFQTALCAPLMDRPASHYF
jgi:hypothetical protein